MCIHSTSHFLHHLRGCILCPWYLAQEWVSESISKSAQQILTVAYWLFRTITGISTPLTVILAAGPFTRTFYFFGGVEGTNWWKLGKRLIALNCHSLHSPRAVCYLILAFLKCWVRVGNEWGLWNAWQMTWPHPSALVWIKSAATSVLVSVLQEDGRLFLIVTDHLQREPRITDSLSFIVIRPLTVSFQNVKTQGLAFSQMFIHLNFNLYDDIRKVLRPKYKSSSKATEENG